MPVDLDHRKHPTPRLSSTYRASNFPVWKIATLCQTPGANVPARIPEHSARLLKRERFHQADRRIGARLPLIEPPHLGTARIRKYDEPSSPDPEPHLIYRANPRPPAQLVSFSRYCRNAHEF